MDQRGEGIGRGERSGQSLDDGVGVGSLWGKEGVIR
jgi:hypothetical protein